MLLSVIVAAQAYRTPLCDAADYDISVCVRRRVLQVCPAYYTVMATWVGWFISGKYFCPAIPRKGFHERFDSLRLVSCWFVFESSRGQQSKYLPSLTRRIRVEAQRPRPKGGVKMSEERDGPFTGDMFEAEVTRNDVPL
ncbi:unnamed protein product [Fusarium graminearum]|nr:unnamed protein product [Fusarium graminearum]CAG1968553.1 unnamed protein product [Fusarium graminearum]CAG1983036.1 unnamed protein product [Fusarium graminearum]VTO82472.1 unnamed protein product [Fusarium graminearum]